MTIRILHGNRSTPVSVLKLGEGLYVAEGADGTHEITTVPNEYGGQTPVENPAAIEQATDGFPLLRCPDGQDELLDGLLDGSLRLEWSPNGLGSWAAFADANGHILVPDAVGLRKSAAWGTIDPAAIAAGDVALRLAEYNAAGTLIGLAWESGQDWRVLTGFKQARLKAVVTRAGTAAIDPVIVSVDVELAAFASAVSPPPSVDPTWDDADLVHHYKSTEGRTLGGGGGVAQLNDLKGTAHRTSSEGDAPLELVGGIEAVRFNGGNYLQGPSGSHTGRTAGHLFLVIKKVAQEDGASTAGLMDMGGAGAGNPLYGWVFNHACDVDYGTDALKQFAIGSLVLTNTHLLEIECDNDVYIIRFNGVEVLNTTNGTCQFATLMRIGVSEPASNLNGNFWYLEELDFSSRQEAGNAQLLRDEIYTTYGITP